MGAGYNGNEGRSPPSVAIRSAGPVVRALPNRTRNGDKDGCSPVRHPDSHAVRAPLAALTRGGHGSVPVSCRAPARLGLRAGLHRQGVRRRRLRGVLRGVPAGLDLHRGHWRMHRGPLRVQFGGGAMLRERPLLRSALLRQRCLHRSAVRRGRCAVREWRSLLRGIRLHRRPVPECACDLRADGRVVPHRGLLQDLRHLHRQPGWNLHLRRQRSGDAVLRACRRAADANEDRLLFPAFAGERPVRRQPLGPLRPEAGTARAMRGRIAMQRRQIRQEWKTRMRACMIPGRQKPGPRTGPIRADATWQCAWKDGER